VSAAPDGKKQPPEMSFAYANRASTALLAVGDIDAIRAPHLDSAICDDGRIITVKFTGMQAEAKRSIGRNDARNFNAAAGPWFAAVGGRASPVCLLAKWGFLAGKRVLPITRRSRNARPSPRSAQTHSWSPHSMRREATTCSPPLLC
jgi:hypothetical protein